MSKSDWDVLKSSLTDDAPIKLVQTETSGRGLVATRQIAPNEIIFEETPLVLGPNQRMNSDATKQTESYLFCAGCSMSLSPICVVGIIISKKKTYIYGIYVCTILICATLTNIKVYVCYFIL